MKLWLIEQDVNDDYDTYDSAVVAAETEDDARKTHPTGCNENWGRTCDSWAQLPEQVRVICIGEARPEIKPGVVLASFNAG